MRRSLKKFFSNTKDTPTFKSIREDEQDKKAQQSYTDFMEAAAGTLNMARDVSTSLRAKIDDFTKQLEATSLVIPDALILMNANGSIETVNQSAEKIFGRPRSELITLGLESLFVSTSGEITIDRFKEIFKDSSSSFDKVRRGELTIFGVRHDGTHFYPNIKVSEFPHSDGVKRFIVLVQDITKNVETEKAFFDVFEEQHTLIKTLPDILITLDARLQIIHVVNQTPFDTIFTEAHIGSNLCDVMDSENSDIFKHSVARIHDENSLETWHLDVTNDNGSITHYEVRAAKMGNDILVILRDETDVVIIREELSESEEHFRAFGQASSEAMVIHNDERMLDWNPRLSEMTGFPAHEIMQMQATDFIHPLENYRFNTVENDAPNNAYTTLLHTKSGEMIEVAINERAIDWKNGKARIKVIRDITNLTDVDHLLHLSRERYKSVTDNPFDVVCCYGMDLELTFVNQTFVDYFGEVEGKITLTNILDPRDHHRVRNHLQILSNNFTAKRILYRVKRDGETRWLDWIDRVVRDENGKFREFQGIGRDVTDYIKMSKNSDKSPE